MSPLIFLYFELRKRNSNVTVLKNGHSTFIHLILIFIQRIKHPFPKHYTVRFAGIGQEYPMLSYQDD